MDVTEPRSFSVHWADWEQDQPSMRAVRTAVFIVEQRVPEQEEWDDLDAVSLHILAMDSAGLPIGTGRLAADGRVGRMAVLKGWRGIGVGRSMLLALIDAARSRGMSQCHLNAQSHALPFYLRHGFEANGVEFMEAGIPHRPMLLRL